MDEKLRRILEAGNSAPSGENCQPWRFALVAEAIDVHLRPERDRSVYNWGQRGSYLALGALVENLVIAASAEGMAARVSYFPNGGNDTLVARVSLTHDAATAPDPLASAILDRTTNRKPYLKRALPPGAKEALERAADEAGGTRLVWCDDARGKERLGRVGSTNEEVMLGNRALHEFFFEHVNWSAEEDASKKIGFYIRTLELPPPARMMFRLMRSWQVMRIFRALGFPRLIAAQNAKTNAAAAAFGALVIDTTAPLDFVRAGRAAERLWLAAAARSLALQPLTGVLFFSLLLEEGDGSVFTPKEQEAVRAAYATAQETFATQAGRIAFMFRIGDSEPPSARAARFPLEKALSAA